MSSIFESAGASLRTWAQTCHRQLEKTAMYDDDSFDDYDVDEDVDPTAPCRSCGRPVYDDSPRCPYCGDYDPHGGRAAWAWARKPRWLIWTAVILVLATTLVFAWPYISILLQIGR